MYVRGHFVTPGCKATNHEREAGAYLVVKLNECGMIRTEQVSYLFKLWNNCKHIRFWSTPNGVNYKLAVVVSFHPLFETRQDEAYSVDCFYKHEQISVNSNMAVNESAFMQNPPESNLKGVVENSCDYSIRVDSVSGPLARFTEIGQPVVHRWECADSLFLCYH
jgi:hypothetical protein